MLLDDNLDLDYGPDPKSDSDDFDPSIFDDPVDNGEDGGADDSDSGGDETGDSDD